MNEEDIIEGLREQNTVILPRGTWVEILSVLHGCIDEYYCPDIELVYESIIEQLKQQ